MLVMSYDFDLFIAQIPCKLFALKYKTKNDNHNAKAYIIINISYIVKWFVKIYS